MEIEQIITKLEHFLKTDGYNGYDPYDGLNSPILRFLTFGLPGLRLYAQQFMKRSPINLRPILGVRKTRNPKAMGLLAGAYLLRYKQTKNPIYLQNAQEILDWLIVYSSPGFSGYCWGYNFDWQSAVFYLPAGTPTAVNTACIANAFLDAYEITKDKNYLDVGRSSCDFILNDLNRLSQFKQTGELHIPFCFSYSPIDNKCVHNANLLAAELLARVYSFTKEEYLREFAYRSALYSVLSQNADGSWFYGTGEKEGYIDNFHTGFVLVSLKNIMANLNYSDNNRFKQILLKGYEYYKKTFFEEDGCPRYYSNKKHPIDLHGSAQGIITCLKFRDLDFAAIKMAMKIANWAVENMWDEKNGYFYFQKVEILAKHYLTIKIPYLRWPNVWMYYALTLLNAGD
ncbi:MAG: delta-aminolevulinic acid dehydratase [candidate division WOR-3 bacterium]